MRSRGLFLVAAVATLSGCGVFASQKDHESLKGEHTTLAASMQRQQGEVVRLQSELEATRQRLENALRANADSGADLVASKQRNNELAGRLDELSHTLDEGKKELEASRSEIYGRLDELKRAQAAVPPAPPAPTPAIPADKAAHFEALEAAHTKNDWALVRSLGPEYVNRYPADEKADDALYLVAHADLLDGRPTSALGHHNRLLKLFPKTNLLDKTLFDMGEAYLAIKDCKNAKLAYQTCESRFAKEPIGAEAKKRIEAVDRAPPGTCAP